jgi:hypothetical protein
MDDLETLRMPGFGDGIMIHCLQDGVLKIFGTVPAGSTDARALKAALETPGVTYAWCHDRPPITAELPTPEERAAIAALTKTIKTRQIY